MSRAKVRCWVITVNNPEEILAPQEWPELKYGVWQLEQGEEGTDHFQGYFSFKEPLRRAAVSKLEGLEHAYLAPRRGTKAQALEYFSKNDTRLEGPWWYPSQEAVRRYCGDGPGKRNDLVELAIMVKAGLTDHELAEHRPVMIIKHHRGITALRTAHFTAGRYAEEIDSVVYVGPTGTGKSWRLRQECPQGPEWFWVMKGKWFDGYQNQAGLVFDEFRDSWMSHSDFLSLVDIYPKRVEFKGSVVQMYATRFRFSTNVHPANWWEGRPNLCPWEEDPARRRIRHIVPMVEPYVGPEVVHIDEAAALIKPRPVAAPPGEAPLAQGADGVLRWNGRDYE